MTASAHKRLGDLPNEKLEAIVQRCERAIFAGTSTHHDVVVLIESEQELLRRQRLQLKQTLRQEARLRESRTRSQEDDALII